uniref:Uncharacterized protein n=1 Tax=Meloidogyne enterolobii TaxID=390850 RepID=A0A6V7X6H8_MELEN|nr:unnamed protein product [Meloidogyne enterolobii]
MEAIHFPNLEDRNKFLDNLIVRNAERDLALLIDFDHNLNYENRKNIERYIPIIFTFQKNKRKIIDNKSPFSMWTNEFNINTMLEKEESIQLANFIENAPTNLYKFFYSEYLSNNENIRNLLQEYFMNGQLINQPIGDEYHPELVEMVEYRGVKIPSQDRQILLP